MADVKTKPTDDDVAAFLAAQPGRRAGEGAALDALFREATGWTPRMWGSGIVGYGAYDYTYASGRKGTWMATGFSPRKAAISIYIMPGYTDFGPILERLGPHRKGKSCLYVTRLERVDTDVLAELIRAGVKDLDTHWPVRAEA